jgi:hypothetical protein
MEKNGELIDLLRQVIKEQPELAQGGLHIHIGNLVLGTDVGTVTALRLLLRAQSADQEEPVLKAKLAP